MKKSITTLMLLLIVVSLGQVAHAEYFSGILLNKYCNSETGYENGMCLGYIVGVVDSFNTTNLVKEGRRALCIPPEVTSGQLVLVMRKSMQEHPETLHLPASAHTLSALSAAFPCQ